MKQEKHFDEDGNMNVYAVFDGVEYKFSNDVNIEGYLKQTCDSKKQTTADNGIYYADELGYVDSIQ